MGVGAAMRCSLFGIAVNALVRIGISFVNGIRVCNCRLFDISLSIAFSYIMFVYKLCCGETAS